VILRDEPTQLKDSYHQYVTRKILFIVGCIALVIISSGYAVTLGGRDISFLDSYSIIWNHLKGVTYVQWSPEWWDDFVVWNARVPRILMAIIAGACLGITGAAMQGIMKNPLADPYTTGIASGAILGVTFAMILGFTVTAGMSQYGIVMNAFLFALIPAGIMIFISRFSNTSPATMILAGVAISYLFNAMSTLIMVTAEADDIAGAYLWQIGTFQNAEWSQLPLMFFITVLGSILIHLMAKRLNLLNLGDDSARSLGLDVDGFRLLCLALISIMVASIVSYTGIIGFVGLVAPHMVRMFIGGDNKFLIPASMVFGAALLLIADIVARVIVPVGELPVGIIMSFIGGPLFLFLIIRQKKEVW